MTENEKQVVNILADPCTSRWLRKSLTTALERDPVDAFRDAQVLCRVMSEHAAETLERALSQVPRDYLCKVAREKV
jgi:hypothetical protein